MFEQAFKSIDDVLWKDAGCTSELDYTEQTSWLLFLKYLDGLEQDKADEAALEGKKYVYILEKPYRWESWAAPKSKGGQIDHNKTTTGDDLRDFVNGKLFPYLHGFKQKATGPNTIEYKIGEIFSEIKNRIQSGYNFREIIDHIDKLRFGSQVKKHELSHLYEAKIKNMGNAGRNGGEYYTPRPLERAIIQVVRPKLGETIYDGAGGSMGFLCEAFDYLRKQNPKRTTAQDLALQERTFYGKEKKSLAYVIGIMNMILHGIEAPNIIHTNTLADNISDKLCRENDLILCVRGSTTGKMNIAAFDACIGRGVAAIRAKQYQPWINHFISSKTDEIHGLGTGATFPNISTAALANLPINVPPLAEQRRIVGILDEAFEGLAIAKANSQQNLQNARALFESHLQAVFTQRDVGWVETTLDKISTNLDSKRIPITKGVRSSGEYPYYGASGIVDYVADYIFDGDTLLISEDGANLLARSTPIAFSVMGKYWVNNHAHILKFNEMATQRFVEFYLGSITLDEYITGAAQPKLNQKALNSIPIPKSIDAQTKIVDSLESLYQRKLAALDELKKSLLHRAFSGEL